MGIIRLFVLLTAAAVVITGCGGARSLARSIGAEEGPIITMIRGVAAAGAHNEGEVRSAAERAGAAIDGAITPLLRSESKESQTARSAFTGIACDAIAYRVQKGTWPTSSQYAKSVGSTLRGAVQTGYGAAETASSAIKVAQSVWGSTAVDQEAVRNVVCQAVGVTIN